MNCKIMTYCEAVSQCPALSSLQAIAVEGNKVVSTVTLPATADVLKDGVTCEVSNVYGAESKSFPVAIKKGQCCDSTAPARAWRSSCTCPPPPSALSHRRPAADVVVTCGVESDGPE